MWFQIYWFSSDIKDLSQAKSDLRPIDVTFSSNLVNVLGKINYIFQKRNSPFALETIACNGLIEFCSQYSIWIATIDIVFFWDVKTWVDRLKAMRMIFFLCRQIFHSFIVAWRTEIGVTQRLHILIKFNRYKLMMALEKNHAELSAFCFLLFRWTIFRLVSLLFAKNLFNGLKKEKWKTQKVKWISCWCDKLSNGYAHPNHCSSVSVQNGWVLRPVSMVFCFTKKIDVNNKSSFSAQLKRNLALVLPSI